MLQFQCDSWSISGSITAQTLSAFVPLTVTGVLNSHRILDTQSSLVLTNGGRIPAGLFEAFGSQSDLQMQSGSTHRFLDC